ncbi:MAG TPA: glycoside hydrolase family 28 protein [Bacteroidota bacterium]|nr:glycoside hydrolase family 28 protein [Bacteroidota bacterium]
MLFINRKYLLSIALLIFCAAQIASVVAQPVPAAYTTGLPFPMPDVQVPTFPDRTVNIKNYGAVGDGQTMNTESINTAIHACATAGGGTVLVPAGTWLTGPIYLESNINLHLEKGALVQFSSNIHDYPFVETHEGKQNRFRRAQLISAYKEKNIAITGEGIFDGAGEIWRYVRKEDLTEKQWKTFVESGGVVSADGEEWWPSKEAMEAETFLKERAETKKTLTKEDYEWTKEYFRPHLVSLVQCQNILLDGPTFENSPKYNIIPQQCENVVIRNVKVLAPASGKNTDAIDPASCRNVIIYNCTIDVGDDGICLKPGTIAQNQTPGPACENIVIADCVVYHAHGGFVIGSESYGGARNVFVRNCNFIGTDVGLRFKSSRGRGGVIEKIFIDGIQMRGIATDAILFDMYYSGGSPDVEAQKDLTIRKAEPLTERTPQFKDFSVKNIICNGADRAVVINGLPELSIKNMMLDHVSITSKRGAYIADADGVQFNNCRIVPQSGNVFTVIQSRNVTINNGTYPAPADVFLKVFGEKSENIRLIGIDLEQAKKGIELEKDVKIDAVKKE